MRNIVFKYLAAALILMLPTFANAQKRAVFGTIQYAGSIGYISLGAGLTNKTNTIHNEVLYGFVPSQYGGPLSKFTYKFTYYPIKIRVSDRITWQPISVGAFFAYSIDHDLTMMPSHKKYDKDYYWWSFGLRKHISFSTSFLIHSDTLGGPRMLIYLEANSNDLYIPTLWENAGVMPFTDIIFLGIGVKTMF